MIETASEATGIGIAKKLTGKQLGNKGAVAIGFRWHDTPLCFIGSHLAARPERVEKRNDNYRQIIEKLSLKMGQDFCVGGSGKKRAPQLTHVFEHLFWLGDLNYRLDHMFSHAVNLVSAGDWNGLAAADQLRREIRDGRSFAEFKEGPLNTCPSYRWEKDEHAFSNKRGQSPSYTDRILWRSMPGMQQDITTLARFRTHVEIQGSDHRPVSSGFQLQLRLPYVPLPGPVPDLFFVSGSWARPHILRSKPYLKITDVKLTMHGGAGESIPNDAYLAFHSRVLETEVISDCAKIRRVSTDIQEDALEVEAKSIIDASGCTSKMYTGANLVGESGKDASTVGSSGEFRDGEDGSSSPVRSTGSENAMQQCPYECRWAVDGSYIHPELPLLMPFLWDPRYLATQHLTVVVHASGDAQQTLAQISKAAGSSRGNNNKRFKHSLPGASTDQLRGKRSTKDLYGGGPDSHRTLEKHSSHHRVTQAVDDSLGQMNVSLRECVRVADKKVGVKFTHFVVMSGAVVGELSGYIQFVPGTLVGEINDNASESGNSGTIDHGGSKTGGAESKTVRRSHGNEKNDPNNFNHQNSMEEQVGGHAAEQWLEESVVHNGWLHKRGQNWHSWHSRWFVLSVDRERLMYFKQEHNASDFHGVSSSSSLLGEIQLKGARVVDREEAAVAAKKKHIYRFSVVTPARELHLAAHDRSCKEKWISILRNTISIINIGHARHGGSLKSRIRNNRNISMSMDTAMLSQRQLDKMFPTEKTAVTVVQGRRKSRQLLAKKSSNTDLLLETNTLLTRGLLENDIMVELGKKYGVGEAERVRGTVQNLVEARNLELKLKHTQKKQKKRPTNFRVPHITKPLPKPPSSPRSLPPHLSKSPPPSRIPPNVPPPPLNLSTVVGNNNDNNNNYAHHQFPIPLPCTPSIPPPPSLTYIPDIPGPPSSPLNIPPPPALPGPPPLLTVHTSVPLVLAKSSAPSSSLQSKPPIQRKRPPSLSLKPTSSLRAIMTPKLKTVTPRPLPPKPEPPSDIVLPSSAPLVLSNEEEDTDDEHDLPPGLSFNHLDLQSNTEISVFRPTTRAILNNMLSSDEDDEEDVVVVLQDEMSDEMLSQIIGEENNSIGKKATPKENDVTTKHELMMREKERVLPLTITAEVPEVKVEAEMPLTTNASTLTEVATVAEEEATVAAEAAKVAEVAGIVEVATSAEVATLPAAEKLPSSTGSSKVSLRVAKKQKKGLLSDELKEKFSTVVNGKSTGINLTNWATGVYKSKNRLVFGTSGCGYAEMKQHLKKDNTVFGLLRCEISRGIGSLKDVTILIMSIGENVGGVQRGKASVHATEIKNSFGGVVQLIHTVTHMEDLEVDQVRKKVLGFYKANKLKL